MIEIYTVGVYNSSEETFFKKLTDNKIDTFIDVRQRRGVRGAKYSFVNSIKLQEKLSNLNIRYIHKQDLSPPTEVRDLQKKADIKKSEVKKNREILDDDFKVAFENLILNKFDSGSFLQTLKMENSSKIVLFCVEENANACHRSIIAKKIATEFNLKIYNL